MAAARPLLRPGWRAVRHDDHHLQLGLDAPARVVLADSPDVRRLLSALADPAADWPPAPSLPARRALEQLRRADLLVPPPGSALEARLAAEHGASAPDRVRARRAARVAVEAPAALAEPLAALLDAEGVAVAGGPDATVTLVAATGPLRRSRVDDLVRDGRPHLLLSGSSTGVELGPFVVPGRTACLRCADAGRAESDPRRAVVAEQLAGAGVAAPSPTLTAAALALAVRDVVAYVDGDVPATWSASLLLTASGPPATRAWARHPCCGCSWDVVLAEE